MIIFAAIDWVSIGLGAVAGALLGTLLAPAGTSLFQSRVDSVVFRIRSRLNHGSTETPTVTGIWRGHYWYTSADEWIELESEHYMVLRQSRSHVVGMSLPKPEGSTVTLDLEIEGLQLAGRFREFTSQKRIYHGAIQLGLDETRTNMVMRQAFQLPPACLMTACARVPDPDSHETKRALKRAYSDDERLL